MEAKDLRTATELEVLRRAHALLIKVIATISITAIVAILSVTLVMQNGQHKAISAAVNAMARSQK